MKNITQTIEFPAVSICGMLPPKQLSEAMVKYAKAAEGPEKEAAREELLAATPQKMLQELEMLGVKLPSDIVEVNLTLGTFLFDMFIHATRPPTPPFAKHLYNKQCQDLASMLDKDEFTAPQYAIDAAKRCMTDDAVWKTLDKIMVWVKKAGSDEKISIPFNTKGVNYFNQIINAAVKLIENNGDEPKATEPAPEEEHGEN